MSQADRPDRPSRRSFTAAFKAAVVAEYDAASSSGERGAILRREGLYDSHVQKPGDFIGVWASRGGQCPLTCKDVACDSRYPAVRKGFSR